MNCIEIYSNFYDYINKEVPSLSEFAFFRLFVKLNNRLSRSLYRKG